MRGLLPLLFLFGGSVSYALGNEIPIKYIEAAEDTDFRHVVNESVSDLLIFSKNHQLGVEKPLQFVTQVVLYGTKPAFDKMISSSAGWPKDKDVPKNYVGIGESKTFHVVSWKAYQLVHPEEKPADYKKLVTHELAHLLHVAYLKGNDNDMGPVWFFEGFACFAANQYPEAALPSKDNIRQIISSSERGDYKAYVSMFRALMKTKDLRSLLKAAKDQSFGGQAEKDLLKDGVGR